MNRFILKIFAAISVITICLSCFYFIIARHISFPQEIKLADCNSGIINIHFTAPRGHYYNLLLKAPNSTYETNGSDISSYKFTGNINIKNGNKLVADFPISSDGMTVIPSGIFTTGGPFQTAKPSLSRLLRSQKDYDLTITLNPQPPASSSIWLVWEENAAEQGQ